MLMAVEHMVYTGKSATKNGGIGLGHCDSSPIQMNGGVIFRILNTVLVATSQEE